MRAHKNEDKSRERPQKRNTEKEIWKEQYNGGMEIGLGFSVGAVRTPASDSREVEAEGIPQV